jgi:2-iminobutanoate/2-iminopropanoate deaminase
MDPATGKPGTTAEESSKLALDALKRSLENAGMTMDDLVSVQIFCTDLTYYAAFNTIYRTYFHGDMPARAFLGVDHLLNNGHFEIMGVAVKK